MLRTRDVAKIVGIYILFGSLWIIFTDRLLYQHLEILDDVLSLSIIKGLIFITVTASLLFVLITRLKRQINDSLLSLRESEKRFEFLVENSLDCLVVVGENGRQKYVSHSAETLFGLSQTELTGKRFQDIIHPDDQPAVMDAWQSITEGKTEAVTIQYRHIHRDGSWIDCEAVARNFLDDPVLRGIVANVRDITDRKHSERALQQRNQFISTILDHLPIGLAVNYINEGTAVYMNRQFEEIYGWPKEELADIDLFFNKVYPDTEYREKLKTKIMQDIESGDMERMFWTNIEATTKGGQKKIIEAKNIPLYEQNMMISTVQDITESRKLQQQLEQMQKLESIGRLAGGIAHDLNNLLMPILGYSEILLDDLEDRKEDYEAAHQILGAAMRARDLVQQLLAFSRRQILEFKPINLNHIVEANRKLLTRTIPEDVQIETAFNPAIPTVLGDKVQILQVLMNLAVNASDAMPNGGKLTIETDIATLDESFAASHKGVEPGRYVLLAVSDNGCGMDEATAKNIFEPFFSTKEEFGTGLGLSTVYGIIKQHGGNIWVYSEPGHGTTFKIYLPAAAEETVIEEMAATEMNLEGSETILLVEDAPQVLLLARKYLEKLGYTVLVAKSGDEALKTAAGYDAPIHLLFTDVVMPGLNGNELYRKIVQLRPAMKVLYMSGYTDNIIAHRGVLDEGVHFLQKPFDLEGLGTKVREVLEEES